MSNLIIYGIGFIAQLLFSTRLIVQWIGSEKRKQVHTSTLFWKLSLLASVLLFIYGYLRNDFSIMLGQIITYFIYIRNLSLQKEWQKTNVILRLLILIFPVIFCLYFFLYRETYDDFDLLFLNQDIPSKLLIWGVMAQLLFTFRFIYQWLYSEKNKESSLPRGFWVLSLIGSVMILIYAIIRKDPVLFIGHLMGIFIYSRNLILLKKQR
ncbi:MAG: lipid-A-disaccharide synthase N-terminal domain-containing protein [Flavobacteriaceae bacterium]|nr:lipid-A-disaccharide synthase N-terminal domain-containing protein [Flavobacteriaceae bacterium]